MGKDWRAHATVVAAAVVWLSGALAGAPGPQSAAGAPELHAKTADPAIPRHAGPRGGIVFTRIPPARAGPPRQSPAGMVRAGYGEGGQIVSLADGGSLRVLTGGFESAADPAVSFDGHRILFAGRKSAADRWNIYEMNADGTGVRQLTQDSGNCRSPVYQSPIFYLDDAGPMPQIAFVSDAPAGISEYGGVQATAIYSVRMDGSGVRRLTYNPSGTFDPAMLPDGRMLFSSWERHDLSHGLRGRIGLFATNIDGTDYATFSGDQGGRIQQMACVTAKRLVLFVDAGAQTWDGAGPLAAIDLRRNLHSYRKVPLPGAFLYHSPSPLEDGSVLVSRRPAEGSGAHEIVRLDPGTGRISPVFRSPGMHAIQARALAPSAIPDGRSSVVDEQQAWAKLYCLDLYESDLGSKAWPRGSVKRVRFLEGLPRTAADAPEAAGLSPLLQKRFLGEIDVDEDGSFHAQIPANLPVEIQALDENGMALRSSAWMWAKNREQRGCIGCHEDGERTPENRMASALTRPAANLTLPPERRRTIGFETDIAPILGRKCAACHGGAARPKLTGPGRRFSAAYEALLEKDPATAAFRYVTPGAARTSRLVWAIFGHNTSRPWDRAVPGRGAAPPVRAGRPRPAGDSGAGPRAVERAVRRMPPAGSPALTPTERRAIVEWIDLGAHYRGLPGTGGR
jgi:hypothetical protein